MFWSPLFLLSPLLDIFVTVYPHTFVVAVSDPSFVMQYLLCFLTTISKPALDISLYYNFLNKCPLPIINQTKLVCLYIFILKSTGIAFKLSKRQNTDQSTYIIIRFPGIRFSQHKRFYNTLQDFYNTSQDFTIHDKTLQYI